MKPKKSLEEWAAQLMIPLYQESYLQTLWSAENGENRRKGWTLKGGIWSPWFINVRPMGSSPSIFFDVCSAMADLVSGHDIDMFIAVEMAGINISGGTAITSMYEHGCERPIGYTRPLPRKVRTPLEALKLLREIDSGAFSQQQDKLSEAISALQSTFPTYFVGKGANKALQMVQSYSLGLGNSNYGQKEFVEGRLPDGGKVGILDDMSMDLGSKLIARLIVLWEAKKRGVSITCNEAFYFLNRSKKNRETGLNFVNEKEKDLYPESIKVHYVIEFDDYLPVLKSFMKSAEYRVISNFQKNPEQFQDKQVQKEVLELCLKTS